jgi:hypothetical protein
MRGPILFKPRKILFFNSHRFALPGMHPAFVTMQQPWRPACQGKRGRRAAWTVRAATMIFQ